MIELAGTKAVIFDFDGLMVESESIAYQVWCEVLGSYGKTFTEDMYHTMIGDEPLNSVNYLIERLDLPIDPQDLLEVYWSQRTERVCREIAPAPGLLDLLNMLKERALKLAVASNSPSNYVHAVLEAIDLTDKFSCIRCREDVSRGKPAPDVYLAAATCLEVEPGRCLVLEDSPIGLEAALNAGMRCIVVPNENLGIVDYSGAAARFTSLKTLLAAIA
jgi:HAD superfamily hydrolase (TIGR01509 family)